MRIYSLFLFLISLFQFISQFAPDALIFFATAAKRDRFRILFSSKDVLNGIFNKVILPNITFGKLKQLIRISLLIYLG